MKNFITARKAANYILAILGLMILFHLSVIIGITPASIIWGGNIPEDSVMPMELIAIVITVCYGLFVLIKMRYVKENRSTKFTTIGLWAISLFFLINAIANIFSESIIEKIIFIPIALLLAFFTFRLAIEK